jgi:hypothetical protein
MTGSSSLVIVAEGDGGFVSDTPSCQTGVSPAVASLCAGATNSGIRVEVLAGVMSVVRKYEDQWVTLTESGFRRDLDLLNVVGLVDRPDLWFLGIDPDGYTVGNPWVEVVKVEDMPEDAVWTAYEVCLARLQKLYDERRAIVGDAHSDNIVPVKRVHGYELLVVDGKVAGVTTCLEAGLRRLSVKLKYERSAAHRWLLREYCEYLQTHASD